MSLPPSIALWHLASLDAPTVAVTWAMAFAWAAHVTLPAWLLLILALGTWAVYIGDRLLDARRGVSPLRDRHHFHWRHRRLFLCLALGAFFAAMALILLYMPVAARERNSLLAAAALVYFAGVHGFGAAGKRRRVLASLTLSRLVPKELLVGIIFTLACGMPALARIPGQRLEMIPAVLCFMMLAWLNCHAIEVWESSGGTQRTSTFRLGTSLAGICLACAAVSALLRHPSGAALLATAAASALMLAWLDRCAFRLTPMPLRIAADLVLLTPIFLLAMQ